MNIVVVESPAKAKTINKYLGSGYEVLASFGHVRDLPAKDGSVDPEQNFHMIWQVDDKAQKRLRISRCCSPRALEKSGPITCPAIRSMMTHGLPKGELVRSSSWT